MRHFPSFNIFNRKSKKVSRHKTNQPETSVKLQKQHITNETKISPISIRNSPSCSNSSEPNVVNDVNLEPPQDKIFPDILHPIPNNTPFSDFNPITANSRFSQSETSQNVHCNPSSCTFKTHRNLSSVTLPKFWETDAQLYFTSIENTFTLFHITREEDKFQLLMNSLDLHHLQRIESTLVNLNKLSPYSHLKNSLLSEYLPTESERFDKLLYLTQLGDSKPSELLFNMRKLLGSDDNEPLLRKLFMDKIPRSIRVILASLDEKSLDKLALRADKILEVQTEKSQPFTKPPTTDNTILSEKFKTFENKINALSTMINELKITKTRTSHPKIKSNNTTQTTSSHPTFPLDSKRFSPMYISNPLPPQNLHRKILSPRRHNFQIKPRDFDLNPRKSLSPFTTNVHSKKIPYDLGSVAGPESEEQMLYIFDPLSKINFLIDTGSQYSILPSNREPSHPSYSGSLSAANNTKVPIFDSIELQLSLNMDRVFSWRFRYAGVRTPILGLDFLRHFNLNIDIINNRLVSYEGLEKPNDTCNRHANPTLTIENKNINSIEKLCDSYSFLFDTTKCKETRPGQTMHYIRTTDNPVSSKVRRLSPERLEILRKELQKLLDLGVISPGNSPYASPVHLVPKKEKGTFRVTGDFRLLNKQTIKDSYPLPFLNDFVDSLSGCRCFSSLDLFQSYHQLPIAPQDREKTCLITPLGSYVYNKMPQGLKNSGNTFQRHMDMVLRGLDFVFCYIDDILIFSKNSEEHLKHLIKVFERLHKHGMLLNKSKCVFNVSEIRFLGHIVNQEGIKPTEDKVEAIRDFPEPHNMKMLRRFLGMINFYRRFIPNCAEILEPLHTLLSPKKNSRKKVEFKQKEKESFQKIKEALANATLLAFPRLHAPTKLYTDASDHSIGGAIVQENKEGHPRPIAFFSKNLNKAQKHYSAFDRELLAIYLSIRHFRYFLEGREFKILTDHRPLVSAFSSQMKDGTSRQTRQLAYIAQFTSDIQWVEGCKNVVADCLSRSNNEVPVETTPTSNDQPDNDNENAEINMIFEHNSQIDYAQMAEDQENDTSISHLQTNNSSLKIIKAKIPEIGREMLGDISLGIFRPLVPVSFRKIIFDRLHGLSHPGIKASQKMISQRFIWSGMNRDIKLWSETCIPCQQTKIIRHNNADLQKFRHPDERFSHCHVDIIGPLPPSDGYSYILTVIDRFTRWAECIPLREITAKECLDAFILHYVSRFGCPSIITTDRGAQFRSALWSDVANFLGATLKHTTSFHPAANGMVERFHRSLKTSLKTQENPSSWHSNLGFVMLGLRAAFKEDIGCSAAELTIGKTLKLPGEFFLQEKQYNNCLNDHTLYRQNLTNFLASIKHVPPREVTNRKSYLDSLLLSCSHVFVRNDSHKNPLQRTYDGPFRVLARYAKYFTLELGSRIDNVSIDRLKAAKLLFGVQNDLTQSNEDFNSDPINLNESNIFMEAAHDMPPLYDPINDVTPTPPTNTSFMPDEQPTEIFYNRKGRKIIKPLRFRKSL